MIPLGIVAAAAPRASGPAAWTPASLGPLEWFDFSDATTVTQVSGRITAIGSKGSGGRVATASVEASQPAFAGAVQNGRDAAVFDGVGDRMNLSSICYTTSEMWFAQVFGRASTGIKSQPLGGDQSNVPPYSVQWWTDNVRYSAPWGPQSSYATHGATSTDTGVFQQILVKGEATTSLYQGGLAVGAPQTTQSGTGELHLLGARGPDHHNGLLCEVIIGTTALTQEDREKLEGYLAHKWGLSGSLPSGHPYKNDPPNSQL